LALIEKVNIVTSKLSTAERENAHGHDAMAEGENQDGSVQILSTKLSIIIFMDKAFNYGINYNTERDAQRFP
jgi:hypothetical protein